MVSEFNFILDLIKRLPDEKSCHQYLASRRWNGYMVCLDEFCGNDKAYIFKDGIHYKCTCCKKIYTARTGTILESSKISLTKWFVGLYLVMHKKGISSVQLAKDLAITQKSAWFLLQRMRIVLGNEQDEQLEGTIEIDETFVGGKNKNRHVNKRVKYSPGRGWPDKTPVFGMLQRGGKLKAYVVDNVNMLTITKITNYHVRKYSDIMSDGFNGYRGLERSF
ncbi:Transposase zinc-ribbon domain-containing protein [Pedobacter hartonius]|uniref:Transposase zinc-ribbon domain-containing protein n=1 Tax=Pedobacter hartonius TaxID=425514 RepID=A0A1H4GSM0_9SPHI|nr:Transposase zinc-ribbon domain-containing protein [Pedobacter hartonius]